MGEMDGEIEKDINNYMQHTENIHIISEGNQNLMRPISGLSLVCVCLFETYLSVG